MSNIAANTTDGKEESSSPKGCGCVPDQSGSDTRTLPARQNEEKTFRFERTIIRSNGEDPASKDHDSAEEEFLKSSIAKLQQKDDSPMIIFLVHGYGSTGSDLREKLFYWEGKIRLRLDYHVLVIPINWDSALSTDSPNWISPNWVAKMLQSNMLRSVERAEKLGEWISKCVTDVGFKGKVGIISHSMGTHAANVMTERLDNCVFSLMLNPHLYTRSYRNVDNSQKVIIVNIGDQVLRGSRSKFMDKSLGDASADPWCLWDNSLRLSRDARTHLWFIDPVEADIYDSSLKHGSYRHPFAALMVVDLVRGGVMPTGLHSRVPFSITHKPIARPSDLTSEVLITIQKRAPFELTALDEYHTALRSRYQAECTGCAMRSWFDDSENTIWEKKLVSREDVRELDGIDWDNMREPLGMLPPSLEASPAVPAAEIASPDKDGAAAGHDNAADGHDGAGAGHDDIVSGPCTIYHEMIEGEQAVAAVAESKQTAEGRG